MNWKVVLFRAQRKMPSIWKRLSSFNVSPNHVSLLKNGFQKREQQPKSVHKTLSPRNSFSVMLTFFVLRKPCKPTILSVQALNQKWVALKINMFKSLWKQFLEQLCNVRYYQKTNIDRLTALHELRPIQKFLDNDRDFLKQHRLDMVVLDRDRQFSCAFWECWFYVQNFRKGLSLYMSVQFTMP